MSIWGTGEDFNRGLHCMLDVGSAQPLHRPFPSRQRRHLHRLQLRRQCVAGQEMSRLAHRLHPRAKGRLAGRAHAHPQRPVARGRKNVRGRRLPQRLRQDQSRHARSPAPFRRLENSNRRRRHRLDETRPRRPPLRHQPRSRLFRRRPGHQHGNQPKRDGHHFPRHHLYQCGSDARPGCLVGRQNQGAAAAIDRLEGTAVDARNPKRPPPTPTAASPRP